MLWSILLGVQLELFVQLDEVQQKNVLLSTTNNTNTTNNTHHSNNSGGASSEEMESLKLINSDKDREIEFLNSIIVDLQKKNKEQKDKIDILSYGDDFTEMEQNFNTSENMNGTM